MIVLEAVTRLAAMAGRAHERALAAVPRPHRAPDRSRDMARVGARRIRRASRPRSRRALAALELADAGVERAIEHRGEIARSDLVAEQSLEAAQLVVRALAYRGLDREALRRGR